MAFSLNSINPFSRQGYGNALDAIGTSLHLPDLGISERVAGGDTLNSSGIVNTAQRNLVNSGVNAVSGRLSSPQQPVVKSIPAQTGGGPQYGPDLPASSGFDVEQYLASIGADGSGSSSSSASGASPAVATYNGQNFDLNDPGQRIAYHNLVQQSLGSQRDQLLQQIQETYRTKGAQAANEQSRALSDIETALQDNQKQAQDFVQQHLRQVSQFNNDKSLGDVQRGQNFASLGANAFQSAQGTSAQYANDQYLQGLGDLEKSAQDTVGVGYLQNPNDPSQLDSNSTFGRQFSGLNRQKGDVGTAYQQYLDSLQQGVAKDTNAVADQYNSGVNSSAQTLGGIAASQGGNPFQFNVQNMAPAQASQVDLSKYTPFTTAQSLSSVPVTAAGGFSPAAASNPFKNQDVTDAYLGRTGTSLNQSGTDYLKNYLLSK